jgi:hypothetical protein
MFIIIMKSELYNDKAYIIILEYKLILTVLGISKGEKYGQMME